MLVHSRPRQRWGAKPPRRPASACCLLVPPRVLARLPFLERELLFEERPRDERDFEDRERPSDLPNISSNSVINLLLFYRVL